MRCGGVDEGQHRGGVCSSPTPTDVNELKQTGCSVILTFCMYKDTCLVMSVAVLTLSQRLAYFRVVEDCCIYHYTCSIVTVWSKVLRIYFPWKAIPEEKIWNSVHFLNTFILAIQMNDNKNRDVYINSFSWNNHFFTLWKYINSLEDHNIKRLLSDGKMMI